MKEAVRKVGLISLAVQALAGRWETWGASPDVPVGVCSKPGFPR
jgi:hypothetical protein